MAEPLTILTWLWRQEGGRASYLAEHVNVWADMVSRHLRRPHRIACVTDTPEGIDGSVEIIAPPGEFEGVSIPSWGKGKPQCFRRLVMFAPDAADLFGPRFVSMDLDCVIGGPLDPLFDRPEDFVIFNGTAPGRPYNGSMMLIRAGSRPQVYTRFTPEGATAAGRRFAGSDQAWLSHCLGPGEATWGPRDGVHFWRRFGARFPASDPNVRLLFFPGQPKPWEVVADGSSSWVAQHYRRTRSGRCLVLSYGPTVWRDAEAALADGPFEAVIASPEAAAHWPVPVDAVARDDDQALRLARMWGFDDVVVCGAEPEEIAA